MTVGEPVTVYFGERWDAPQLDGLTRCVDPPVGVKCAHCAEPVAAEDRGLMRVASRVGADGEPVGSMEPIHLECDLRMALGNVYHHSGQCRYTGDCHQHETGTWREQGQQLLAFIDLQRACQGMGPLCGPDTRG